MALHLYRAPDGCTLDDPAAWSAANPGIAAGIKSAAGGLEVRQEGRRRRIRGRFPYNSTAVVASRGRQRKEKFAPHALDFAIKDETRPIHLLVGHSYDRPLAVRAALPVPSSSPLPLPSSSPSPAAVGVALQLVDNEDALEFETSELPEDVAELPSYYQDILKMIDMGLSVGLSPGFNVPPADVVPGAEELVPEPGNEDILIRIIHAAVLFELSIVTRAAYPESFVDLRSADFRVRTARPRL